MVTCTQTLRNKTYEYLTPILRTYESNLLSQLNSLNVIAYGIGDNFDKNNEIPSFYVLIDSKNSKKNVLSDFLKYLEEKDFYVKNYNSGRSFIMVVIKVPEDFHNAYYKFKKSKYSEMYTKDQIEMFFNTKKRENTYQKLLKSTKGLKLFKDIIFDVFDSEMTEEDLISHPEYDLPIEISIQKEIFNYRKKNRQ